MEKRRERERNVVVDVATFTVGNSDASVYASLYACVRACVRVRVCVCLCMCVRAR
jgi:hypothetical protein